MCVILLVVIHSSFCGSLMSFTNKVSPCLGSSSLRVCVKLSPTPIPAQSQSLPVPSSSVFLYKCNPVYCMCFGLWPFNLFFLSSFSFWLGGSFMAPVIWSVKTCAPGPPRPLSPSVPAVAGRQLVIVRAAAYASDSGESLHCFLAGANKSYVIATSDLWLFIHASNLLPSLPPSPPPPPHSPTKQVCRGAVWGGREAAGWKHESQVTSQRLL